jgi:hypothetical protein
MNRWIKPALLGLSCAAVLSAAAQGIVREAPKDVKPGLMAVSATPPIIAIDGKEDRLSPGARVRDLNNMQVLSGALAGKTLHTVYRRDPGGQVHEVWLLTPEEYAKVGGIATGDPQGHKRFLDLLNLIWTARMLAGFK